MSKKQRPSSKEVKEQLYLKCGRVDFYSMEDYADKKLQLHHDPPFSQTKHTIYEESFLVSEETHKELHRLYDNNIMAYHEMMLEIRYHKSILENQMRLKRKMR